jgi:putative membrane protein
MGATFLFGGLMIWANPDLLHQGWFHAKLTLVLVMAGAHGAFSKWRRDFEQDRNTRPARFYRIVNELPPVLVVFIVILVIVKPF